MHRPNTATVVAFLALALAITSPAWGGPVAQIAKSISGSTIKKGTITARQIKTGAITSKQIKNRTIQSVDIAPGVLKTGATGATGLPGAKGDAGPAGPTVVAAANTTSSGAGISTTGMIVVDLNGANSSTPVAPITLPFAGHIFAAASVDLEDVTVNPARVRCNLGVAPVATPSTLTTVGTLVFDDLAGAGVPISGDTSGAFSPASLVGNVAEPAGAYNVGVFCKNMAVGTGTAEVYSAAINVFATPT